MYKADRWEKPRKAPLAPPNSQARKRSEAHVKQALRDAEKVESNRHKKRFATSNSNADKIRDSALAKAKENRTRAPPPPRPVARPVIEDACDSSAYPAPLNIRKKHPPPPPPKQQQRSARQEELANTISAFKNAAKVDQSHIHPALRRASSPRPTDQSHIHPALRNTALPTVEIHPALGSLPPNPTEPRRISDMSQSSLERDICSYLGNSLNYADSPRESKVSPVNVAQKLPYKSLRTKRR